jgi:MoaA/NifB/PqqE/SkfB family radical SAM enzyme
MEIQRMARAGLAVARGRLVGVRSPLFVILSVTNRCLSHCRYCRIPDRSAEEMSTGEIFRLIDEMARMGTQRLGIWGGEPLIRDDIGDIVSHARKNGIYVTLDSNGYLLPQRIKDLRELDHLILALDGPKEAHDANREPGAWDKVMAALDVVPQGTTLWTITVLTKHNVGHIPWILDMAEKKKFMAAFQVLHHPKALGINDLLMPEPDAYRDALTLLIDEKKKGRRVGTSFSALRHLLGWHDYRENRECARHPDFDCWAGKFYCNVDCDGSVYPCSLLTGEVPPANFLERGFENAYRSLAAIPCRQCLATCYSEYNLLFSMKPKTIWEWACAMRRRG